MNHLLQDIWLAEVVPSAVRVVHWSLKMQNKWVRCCKKNYQNCIETLDHGNITPHIQVPLEVAYSTIHAYQLAYSHSFFFTDVHTNSNCIQTSVTAFSWIISPSVLTSRHAVLSDNNFKKCIVKKNKFYGNTYMLPILLSNNYNLRTPIGTELTVKLW